MDESGVGRNMAGGIVERPSGEPYDMSMEARVAVLESIAAQTSATLTEIKQEMRDFRRELHEFRGIHDRDFRITFGAIITTTIGLAALIAHVAHWL